MLVWTRFTTSSAFFSKADGVMSNVGGEVDDGLHMLMTADNLVFININVDRLHQITLDQSWVIGSPLYSIVESSPCHANTLVH